MKKHFTVIILVLCIAMIIAGIFQEQNIVVLQKAIKICLECIGIG